ncbi:UNVERIFIED_CONTAM: Zinc finger BED domain-containing protein RICESLEEPER 2 [Sesamum latifolium]|uniref:Zinc finger BED domain-containing protein RICESLEEPER 2 n=1 Tax=Sesamum latifolium TaxID=2727402 RepID=A0AAW2TP58_9LAMI
MKSKTKGQAEFILWAQELDTIVPTKSDLDIYLEEGLYVCKEDSYVDFNALDWWKSNTLKFRTLSNMARDILSIPITTVASESAFSAGGRVLDQYRSSLKPETVQALICTGDWLRSE